jgi:hypothetical protein
MMAGGPLNSDASSLKKRHDRRSGEWFRVAFDKREGVVKAQNTGAVIAGCPRFGL